MTSLGARYTNIDPKLIWECATGLEDTEIIAERYGFDPNEWLQIEQRPEVKAQIEKAKAELEKSGVTFQNKAKLMADNLLNDVFQSALSDTTPVKDKVAALQAVSKLAGWDTGDRSVQAGPGFSITINLPKQTVTVASEQITSENEPQRAIEPQRAEVHLEFKDGKTKGSEEDPR
jgi:hypothetical protein